MFPFGYGFPMANQEFFMCDQIAVLFAEFFQNRPILRIAPFSHVETMFVDVNEEFVEGIIAKTIGNLERR